MDQPRPYGYPGWAGSPGRPDVIPLQSPAAWSENQQFQTFSSNRKQSIRALTLFLIGFLVIGACIAGVVGLWAHGPAQVPGEDTRYTAILISFGKSLTLFFINAAIARCAWASFLPRLLQGSPVSVRSLIAVCRNIDGMGQIRYFRDFPNAVKAYAGVSLFSAVAMLATSASFRYDSLSISETATASVPDVAALCTPPQPAATGGYFCNGNFGGPGNINSNTTTSDWSYIQQVYSGGQGTVSRTDVLGVDDSLAANVTLAALPAGWILSTDHSTLPWMAMSVTCSPLSISASFNGSGLTALTQISVNGSLIDTLDIANMPAWGSIVHLYQQINDSGPASSLCPWKVVMLSRDLDDGTANFANLNVSAVTALGNSYLDLHGYPKPQLQAVLGAAAYCSFTGSTGGTWPSGLWPPRNGSTNFIAGDLVDDTPTYGTALLNYGPSWQYNPVSENTLPGGSVAYIANTTVGTSSSFADVFASYVRNQWTLMAFSIAPQSGHQIQLAFEGPGPQRLFISLTAVAVIPLSALALGLAFTVWAMVVSLRNREWVGRLEFDAWWLVKALRQDVWASGEVENATEKEFLRASEGFKLVLDPRTGWLVNPGGHVQYATEAGRRDWAK